MANDLPQYPLPNPGLPLGQQPVPLVAQTNPLMSAASGINTGAQLGLQARQAAMQQQQLQIQMMQAQAQAKIAQQEVLKGALTNAHQDFDTLAKINPDMAVDYYHNKIAPLQDEFWGQYGIKMDSSQIPPSHNNADVLSQANQLTDLALNDPSKVSVALGGMSKLSSQMDIAPMVQEKLAAQTKLIQSQQEQAFNQQKNVQTQTQQGVEDFNKAAETAIKANNAAIEGKSLLASGNPIGEDVVSTIAPAAADVQSRMSPAVIQRYGGSQAIGAKIAQSIEEAKTGKFTADNKALFSQVLDIMQKSSSNVIDNAVGSTATKYAGPGRTGYTPMQLAPMIGGQYGQQFVQKRQAAIQWAQQNPNDPRSAAIIQKAKNDLGIQ